MQIILKILKFSNPNYVDVILIVGKKQVCKMLGMTEKGLTLDTLKEPKSVLYFLRVYTLCF